jgi:hypothetical protein
MDDRLTITQAAAILKVRYQRARDWALQGRFGEIEFGENGRYTVPRTGVERVRDEESPKAEPSDPDTP